MNKHGLLSTLLAASLGLAVVTPGAVANAKPKSEDKKVSTAEPAVIPSTPKLKPKGLKFGMSKKKVVKVIYKVIDRDYRDRMNDASPGIQMQRLEYEIQQKKDAFHMSLIDFKSPPSSYDGSFFVPEFSYGNKEAAMHIRRKVRKHKKRTYIFFIQNKMWKTVDVFRLKDGAKWGSNYKDAVKKIEKALGAAGRHFDADPDNGRDYEEVDWADAKVHFRVANWGKKIGLIWVDKATEARLPSLRTAKEEKKEDIDPSVKAVLR